MFFPVYYFFSRRLAYMSAENIHVRLDVDLRSIWGVLCQMKEFVGTA